MADEANITGKIPTQTNKNVRKRKEQKVPKTQKLFLNVFQLSDLRAGSRPRSTKRKMRKKKIEPDTP